VSTPLGLSDLDLPRRNGELAFDAPWQSTVFALAAAVIEHAFGGPYWESWTTALEMLVHTLPATSRRLRKDQRDDR
jgi:hypothetical protein